MIDYHAGVGPGQSGPGRRDPARREDPGQAQALYNLFAIRCGDPHSTERLLTIFDELGIPTAALSHKHRLVSVPVT